VVRPGVANKRLLARLRDSFKTSRVRVLGHVVNGALAQNEGYAFYAYYNRYANGNGAAGAAQARLGGGRNGWFNKSGSSSGGKRSPR
jgi:Mrp family chromosome partitioning ATPase